MATHSVTSPTSPQGPTPPVVKRRQMSEQQRALKNELFVAFERFSTSTVSQEQIGCARECIASKKGNYLHYERIPFQTILKENGVFGVEQRNPDQLTMMTSAYDLLLKYVINLLKPKRPQVWRSIKTNNTAFKARVACMKGAKDILKKIGYSVETPTALQFPEAVLEPDYKMLRQIAAELLMAKLEVEEMNLQSSSPSQQRHSQQQQPQPQGYPQPQEAPQSVTSSVRTDLMYNTPQTFPSTQNSPPIQQRPFTTVQPTQSYRPPHGYGGPPPPSTQIHPYRAQNMAPLQPSQWQQPPVNGYNPQPQPHTQQSQPLVQNLWSGGDPSQPSQMASTLPPQIPSSGGGDPILPSQIPSTSPHHSGPQPNSMGSQGSSGDSTYDSASEGAPSPAPGESGRVVDSHWKHLESLKRRRQQLKEPGKAVSSDVNTPSPITQEEPRKRSTMPIKTLTETEIKKPFDDRRPVQRLSPVQENEHQKDIKYPPKNRRHPEFQKEDTIPEEEPIPKPDSHAIRQEDERGQQQSLPTSGTFCSNCKNRVSPTDGFCSYCMEPVNVGRQSSTFDLPAPIISPAQMQQDPPELPPKPKPKPKPHPAAPQQEPILRASPQATQQAERQHQMSRVHHIVDPNLQPPHSQQGPPSELFRNPASVVPTTSATPPPIQYRTEDPPQVSSQGQGQGAMSAASVSASVSQASGSGAGATGSTSEPGWITTIKEKEEAWKKYQAEKLGRRPEEFEPLHPEPESEQKAAAKQQAAKQQAAKQQAAKQQAKTAKRKPDLSKYDRVNESDVSKYRMQEEQRRKMEKLGWDGRDLLNWVKQCTGLGYSLGEVQIAYSSCSEGRTPLNYLKGEWLRKIHNVQVWVSGYNQDIGQSVGYPSEVEARKFLLEADGDVMAATHHCHGYRRKRIEKLIGTMTRKNRPINWEGAVKVLSAHNMDVAVACYSMQCEGLHELYDYIFSGWSKVAKTDNEDIKALMKRDDIEEEVRVRLLMGEFKFETQERAHMVLDLMKEVETVEQQYPFSYYVEGAKDYETLEDAKKHLIKPCPICDEKYLVHEMVLMPACNDSMCKECFSTNFTIVITEQSVKHFNCPVCREPNLADRASTQDMYLLLFQQMIKQHVAKDVYDLFMKKLTDFNLSKEAGFRWCAHGCGSGFVNERDIYKIQCPNCSKFMCFKCKKPWEPQHQGLTCEQFTKWKQDNDPETQKQGLAAHLKANGIECPQCHMRYELARGGCMHFKCTQCPEEFCSGCGQSFKQGQACGKFESCGARGLHAHHPRDCLFYLRDFDVGELQQFLRDKNIAFDTEPPQQQIEAAKQRATEVVAQLKEGEEQVVEEQPAEARGEEIAEEAPVPAEAEAAGGEEVVELKCRVVLQKELQDGLVDDVCGRAVKDGHAGLCEVHYKEYLVCKINQEKLDPITLYSTDKIGLMLVREEMEVPEKEEDEEDADYRERLIGHVQQQLAIHGGLQAAAE